MINEKHIEEMLDYAQAHGLDDLGVRLQFDLVLGPKKIKMFAVEGDPAVLKATFDGFASKWDVAVKTLQGVLDDLAKVEAAPVA